MGTIQIDKIKLIEAIIDAGINEIAISFFSENPICSNIPNSLSALSFPKVIIKLKKKLKGRIICKTLATYKKLPNQLLQDLLHLKLPVQDIELTLKKQQAEEKLSQPMLCTK